MANKVGGSRKLRRVAAHKDYYAAQFNKTALNKIRRMKRKDLGRLQAEIKRTEKAKENATRHIKLARS
jgi:hypothetical protein